MKEISLALNKIDAAVVAVQELSKLEVGQQQLRDLQRISRTLAQQETALMEVFK